MVSFNGLPHATDRYSLWFCQTVDYNLVFDASSGAYIPPPVNAFIPSYTATGHLVYLPAAEIPRLLAPVYFGDISTTATAHI